MKYFPHLKIEFRAVPYSDSHVLEYRINPNQDITYKDEINIFGLFTISLNRKFNTSWHQPYLFFNHTLAYQNSKNNPDNYIPIILHNKKEFEEFKNKYKTIGEFFDYMNKEEEKEIKEWKIDREEYLKNCGTWE